MDIGDVVNVAITAERESCALRAQAVLIRLLGSGAFRSDGHASDYVKEVLAAIRNERGAE